MFIKVHRPSQLRGERRGSMMLLNTDYITSVIDRGTHLEIRDTANHCYEITESLSAFWSMVHPDDPVPMIFKNPEMVRTMIGGKERRNNVTT